MISLTRKQLLILLSAVQALLIGLLFLPVASYVPGSGGTTWLTSFDLAQRYADAGYAVDSGVYLFFAMCCPLVSLPAMFLVHRQRTAIGVVACLSAMVLLVHACFYTAAKTAITASVTLGGRYFFLIIFSLVSFLLSIYGYLFVDMDDEADGKSKK